jgi:hypothetical protein
MGDAIERARQKVHDQIAAREERSTEQSTSDRAVEYHRREEVPATPNQIRRDDRQREFDAERNRPTVKEQQDARKASQDYISKQRTKARHKEFDDSRDEAERKRRVERQLASDAKAKREEQEREGGTSAREFREMKKRNEDKEFRNQHVDPMLSFKELMVKKAKGVKQEFVARTKDALVAELKRPGQAVQAGRQKRRQVNQEKMIDPFGQLAAPQPRRASRSKRTQVPMGTGFLFSEGFLNPPKAAGRKTKKPRAAKQRGGYDPWDMLL